MAQKPSIPKGTRDFSPLEMMRRQYIFDKIRDVFRTFGFGPLETPAMENLSTLLGKYGDEGDKLLFKILNSGDYAAGLNDEELRTASRICEKGLRYDLTVPFARYVVQHQSEIAFPFKRYQINRSGGPTVRRKAATGSFTSATWMSSAPDRCCAKWNSYRSWNGFSGRSELTYR